MRLLASLIGQSRFCFGCLVAIVVGLMIGLAIGEVVSMVSKIAVGLLG